MEDGKKEDEERGRRKEEERKAEGRRKKKEGGREEVGRRLKEEGGSFIDPSNKTIIQILNCREFRVISSVNSTTILNYF